MKRICVILTTLLLLTLSANAQELELRIQVNHSNIQGADRTVFENLQKSLNDFIQGQVWTNNVYKPEERIKCNMLINITQYNHPDDFQGTIQIISSRPVYGTGYESPMLKILDKNVRFRHTDGEEIVFNENSHNDLSSLIAYYVYIILGFDYDSFSKMGGTPYFEKAQQIVTNAQGSQFTGWKSYEDRKNRYWLTENLMNSVYAPIREFNYTYHRLGMDILATNPIDAARTITTDMNNLLKVNRQKSASYLMQIMCDAKVEEFVNVFSGCTDQSLRNKAYNVLKEIDAGNISKYDKIKNTK